MSNLIGHYLEGAPLSYTFRKLMGRGQMEEIETLAPLLLPRQIIMSHTSIFSSFLNQTTESITYSQLLPVNPFEQLHE